MSFIADQIRRIDAQLDRVQLLSQNPSQTPPQSIEAYEEDAPSLQQLDTADLHTSVPTTRILELQSTIRALSPGANGSLLKERTIQYLLSVLSSSAAPSLVLPGQAPTDPTTPAETHPPRDPLEEELEWLLVSKAANQVYGCVLARILDETVRLADDVWYWDQVLGSRMWTAIYGVQISPWRVWDVIGDVRTRVGEEKFGVEKSWRQFYGVVRGVVRERSVKTVRSRVLSPVMRLRGDVRAKKAGLKRIRLRHANALGVLLGEGLANESAHGEGFLTPQNADFQHRWKALVARNVALMEAVLTKATDLETPIDKFDAAVGRLTEDDPLYAAESTEDGGQVQVRAVAERLSRVLMLGLPQYAQSTKAIVKEHGKPSRVVRYWLPLTVGVLSSTTILRILVNRQADIEQWIRDAGATALDFWQNWVVEPTLKVIKTIRHDEGSEVSIMSKRSLEGDRESLERMVVEFAIDNPAHATGSSSKLNEAQIADIRTKVQEGDLTPVLRAYEKDLTSPFMGTVRGNLIRALLIQIQKTKVDVEIAIGGIDSLLKSQELVFGFVGLTPGILVTYFALRSIRNSFTEKRGGASLRKQGKMLRQLRNIDRILVNSSPTEDGELYYQDQGLLLCEVHVLRQAVEKSMPHEIYKEFNEDAEELCDVRMGVERQRKAADRIRWAYTKWIS